MPRQRSSGRPAAAPSRPSLPARAAPAPTQQQARPATTYAPAQAPPAAAAAPVASQGPGLFGQMASTAAGVAVGSTIGHAVSGLFSGGGSSAQAEAAAPQQVTAAAQGQGQNQFSSNCAGAAESFTKCMDDNNGNMQICNWYLEQLKACQQAAKQY
ncbi:putative CHCH domain-containing protein [Rosellinia necatrix]|uniref:Putative CHCH domain-containing protein n=1 Tax=Rosellinia necatrix TaxID=77044 RepID=A0A1S8ABM3_ROSNE|nr:putative CHCH domain-containing protein [Rosellinia necatrix]